MAEAMNLNARKAIQKDDIIIAFMGPSGTGKSHFIDLLTGQQGKRAGNELKFVTSQIQATRVKHPGWGDKIVLVDIPGFDDTTRSDMEILAMIGNWLQQTHEKGAKLTGLIYLHRIDYNQMAGSPLGCPRMLKKLCGDAAMNQVILVSTMWEKVRHEIGVTREEELKSMFWEPFIDRGSRVARLEKSDSQEEAWGIVEQLIKQKEDREAVLLQEELVELEITQAGKTAYTALQKLLDDQREMLKSLLAQVEKSNDPALTKELRKEYERIENQLQKTLEEVKKLKIPLGRRIMAFFFGKTTRVASQSRVQARLHSRVSQLAEIVDHRAKAARLTGNDAQLVVDYLNDLLHEVDILKSRKGKCLLDLLCELAKSAKVHPRCYTLRKGIQRDPQPVGGGGFADVYKGTHKGRVICLKVCRIFQKQGHADFLRTHMKEIIVWAHLSHPNILPFYGVYLDDELQRICLLSPWMEKGNLREYLGEHPSTPWSPLVLDIIDGLRYLHGLDIIHGDLKAENVLLSDDGRALITDFGVSYIAMNTADRFRSATFSGGTVRWNAPELLSGGDVLVRPTTTSDIWSFGCLCYEVLTRKIPFYQYERDYQVINAVQSRQEVPIRPPTGDGSNAVDDRVWRLMADCWNYEPQKRPTCEAIRKSIADLESQGNRPMPSLRNEDNLAFWKEMRAKSDVKIDYERVAQILLDLGTETS